MADMLKALKLTNFQAHRKKILKFAKVTTLVGPSDKGKSSVVRALYWLYFHKPGGAGFIRRKETSCSVALKLSTGIVSKERTKNKTVFTYQGQDFNATARKIPDEIAADLLLSDINFQLQHDPAFWMHLSGGQVSGELNRIANLGVIDSSLQYLKTKRNKFRTKKELCVERLTSKKKELQSLSFFEQMKKDYARLIELETSYNEQSESCEELSQILKEVKEALASKKVFTEMKQDALQMSQLHQTCIQCESQSNTLEQLILEIELLERVACFSEEDFSATRSLHRELETILDECRSLEDLIFEIGEHEKKLSKSETELKEAHASMHNEFENCPLCGSHM